VVNIISVHDVLDVVIYEQLVEHAFISELLQEAWYRYGKAVEVLRSEIDSSGYDLLLECNGVIRYVELKTSGTEARRSFQSINTALAQKPSGCVVWLMREDDESKHRVNLKYLFFGDLPGKSQTLGSGITNCVPSEG